MSWYRRQFQPGGTFFFTVVTHLREPIFTDDASRSLLRDAIEATRPERPFETIAMVLLPEHLHCVWRLPQGDADFSTRWRLIKTRFTQAYRRAAARSHANWPQVRRRRRADGRRVEYAVWQRRFWEHRIRDQVDLKRHADYIHYNPVKHGHVRRAADWPYSTFNRFVEMGEYERDWGQAEPKSLVGWQGAKE